MQADLRFFFFGCWNRDNCDGDRTDYRRQTLDLLTERHQELPYDFGLILGDNIYPHRTASGKQYRVSTLRGFAQLLSLSPPVDLYGLLGNHDVEDQHALLAQRRLCQPRERAQSCTSRWKLDQNSYSFWPRPLVPAPQSHVAGFALRAAEKKHIAGSGARAAGEKHLQVIVIDTNLLSASPPPPVYQDPITPDFDTFFRFTNRQSMLDWLDQQLRTGEQRARWTVVAGHEPIFAEKRKKAQRCVLLDRYRDLMDVLAKYRRVVYLCADVHNFQAVQVAWTDQDGESAARKYLPIIVSGTGGALPDPLVTDPGHCLVDDRYRIDVVQKDDPYGFCSCAVSDDQLSFTYYRLDGAETTVIVSHDGRIDQTRRQQSERLVTPFQTPPQLCQATER